MYQKIKRNFEASYCRKSSHQDRQNHKKLMGSFIMIMTLPRRQRSVRRACTALTTEDADTKEASSEAARRAVAASEVARCSCPAQTSHEWRQFQSDKRLAQADTSPPLTFSEVLLGQLCIGLLSEVELDLECDMEVDWLDAVSNWECIEKTTWRGGGGPTRRNPYPRQEPKQSNSILLV